MGRGGNFFCINASARRFSAHFASRATPARWRSTVSISDTTDTSGTTPKRNSPVLVLGPPRSGKTSALLIPNVMSAHAR